jgi:tagatose 1,6-diphosphate aldolase
MTQRPGLATLGKRWALRRMADARGHFRMLATDQRPPIQQIIARALGCAPEAVAFSDIVAVKRLLAEELAPHATAVLADPNFSYPVAIDALSPQAGLILTLEEHRFTDTPEGRLSGSIPGWTVDRIKRVGADGVKVLVWYRPDASADVRAHQQSYVRQVGRECAAHDIPLVLELLVYPFARVAAARAEYAEDPARHPQMVIDSVREFARPEYGVDLLKLESPLPASLLPPDNDAAGTARVQSLFDALAEATGGLPWVMLSAGAAKADFQRVLRFAYKAGAAGFLAGRAIWADAMAAWPDREACRAGLRASGVPYMRELAALTAAAARGWQCDYDDLRGIGREGEFVAAVPALGAMEDQE